MILLCEDGSLRIYMANITTTNFWLSPYLQPQSPIAVLKPVKKKRTAKSGQVHVIKITVFFQEHCISCNLMSLLRHEDKVLTNNFIHIYVSSVIQIECSQKLCLVDESKESRLQK